MPIIGDQEALQPGQLPPDLLQRIEKVRRQGQVLRLWLYSSLGQVAYSSETAEIGTINRDPYFQEILIGHRIAAAQSQGRRNLPNSSAVLLALASAALLAAAGLSASGARLALRGRKAAPAGGEVRRKTTRDS